MHEVYLGLGSNLDDRLDNLQRAIDELDKIGQVVSRSKIFETEPWGEENQPKFLNTCVKFETEIAPEDLLESVKAIEKSLGREDSYRWGPRLIDIDILFYDQEVVNSQRLTIPHPGLAQRAFVLVPLTQIGARIIHPTLGQTVEQLLAAVDSRGVVESSQQWQIT